MKIHVKEELSFYNPYVSIRFGDECDHAGAEDTVETYSTGPDCEDLPTLECRCGAYAPGYWYEDAEGTDITYLEWRYEN